MQLIFSRGGGETVISLRMLLPLAANLTDDHKFSGFDGRFFCILDKTSGQKDILNPRK